MPLQGVDAMGFLSCQSQGHYRRKGEKKMETRMDEIVKERDRADTKARGAGGEIKP